MKKHIMIILLGAIAYCANAQEKNPLGVFVPDLEGGMRFSLGTFYAEPSINIDYAELSVPTATGSEIDVQTVDGNANWGILAEMGYVFPHSGTEIFVTYNYINTDGDNSASGNILFEDSGDTATAADNNIIFSIIIWLI